MKKRGERVLKSASEMRELARKRQVEIALERIEQQVTRGETEPSLLATEVPQHVRDELEKLGYSVGDPYVRAHHPEEKDFGVYFVNVSFADEIPELKYETGSAAE